MKYLLLIVFSLFLSFSASAYEPAPPFPTETSDWLDGKPLQWKDLQGRVVLLNVWTFGCWNSYRSLPWVVSLKSKFPALQIIGVHSPEFAYEKDRNALRKTLAKYHVNYPQLLDDDRRYWRVLNNRYWPAFYIVDADGTIRGKFAGETHAGDTQAQRMEDLIQRLFAENRREK